MIPKKINDFRNGRGFIYATKPDGTTILESWKNTPLGGRKAMIDALSSAPIIGSRLPVATISVSATATANVTSITILGVNQLGGNVAILSSDTTIAAATKIANAINSFAPASGLDYIAKAFGEAVDIFPPDGTANPASLNGQAVTVATSSGSLVVSHGAFAGGSSEEGIYDSAYGRRYFLNAEYDATPAVATALGNALEISSFIIKRGVEVKNISETAVVSSDSVKASRKSSTMILSVDTEASAAADDLKYISPEGFAQDDILVVQGVSNSRKTTLKHSTGTGENIFLANGSFETGQKYKNITLKLTGTEWNEVGRSVLDVPTVANLRKNGIAQGVEGVTTTALTSTGGTIFLTPGVSKRYQLISGADVTAGSSWTIAIDGVGVYMEGDTIEVDLKQKVAFSGSNSLTIFGLNIPKEVTALGGIKATTTKGAAGWHTVITYDPLVHSSVTIPNESIGLDKISAAAKASMGTATKSSVVSVIKDGGDVPTVAAHNSSWGTEIIDVVGTGKYSLSISGADFDQGTLWLPGVVVLNKGTGNFVFVKAKKSSKTALEIECKQLADSTIYEDLDGEAEIIIKQFI